MKCFKCGAEQSESAKFCSFCGEKITEKKELSDNAESNMEAEKSNTSSFHTIQASTIPDSSASKAAPENKILVFWNRLDLFLKVSAVSIVVAAILLLVSICAEKTLAIFLSIIQLGGLIAAILMHKNVIKLDEKKKWIKFIVLIAAILFTALNVMSYSWKSGNSIMPDTSFISVDNTAKDSTDVSAAITVAAPYGAAECVGQDYLSIQSDFKSAGFTSINVKKIEDLKPSESDRLNTIESISVDGNAEFIKGQDFDFDDAVVISYHTYEPCKLKIHVDFVENLMFSTYDVNLLLNGVKEETLKHGTGGDFEFSVEPGDCTITFENAESSSVNGKVTLTVDCDIEAGYKISCNRNKINIETLYVDKLIELAEETHGQTETKNDSLQNSEYSKLSDDQFKLLTSLMAKSFYDFSLSESECTEAEKAGVMDCLNHIYDYAYSNNFEIDPEFKKVFASKYEIVSKISNYDLLEENFMVDQYYDLRECELIYSIDSYSLDKEATVEYEGVIYVDAEGYLDKGVAVYWVDEGKMSKVGEIKDIAYNTEIDGTTYAYALNVEFYDDPDSSGWRDGESFLMTNKKLSGKPLYYIDALDVNRKIKKETIDFSGNVSWIPLKKTTPKSGMEVYMGMGSAKTLMFTIVETDKNLDIMLVEYPSGSTEYKSYSAMMNNDTLYVK